MLSYLMTVAGRFAGRHQNPLTFLGRNTTVQVLTDAEGP